MDCNSSPQQQKNSKFILLSYQKGDNDREEHLEGQKA